MLSGGMPRRNIYVEIIASLLLIFFVHTLISSYIQLQSLKNLLAFYTINTTTVAWLMIITELVITVLLFIPRTRMLGFIFVLLSSIFALYIIFKRPHLPHDFGGIMNALSRKQQPVFYSLLLALPIIGVIISFKEKATKPSRESQQVIYT
jgi:hypothetical protein